MHVVLFAASDSGCVCHCVSSARYRAAAIAKLHIGGLLDAFLKSAHRGDFFAEADARCDRGVLRQQLLSGLEC